MRRRGPWGRRPPWVGGPAWGRDGRIASDPWHASGEWRRRPGPGALVRRLGCLLFAIAAFLVGSVTIATWLVARLLGGPETEVDAILVLGVGLLLLVVVGTVGSVLAFGRLARPVAGVMDATERLADGDLGARAAESGPPPVRRLAGSFNRMAERLAAAEDRRRALLADVSHELRTPLTVIGGGLEAIADGVHPADAAHLDPLIEETRVLARLIEDLRTLSLSEAGALQLRREAVDAAELIEETAAAFEAAAGRAGLTIDTRPQDTTLSLDADPVRVREVLGNLVTNAIRHTPPGGRITLSTNRSDDAAELVVADTGEGIPRDAVGAIFDRYQRSDRGESGLGLAIARSLVVAHGGSIVAESAGAGAGTTIRVWWPAAS